MPTIIIDGAGTANPVKVTVGERIKDNQVILQGLTGGEFIATEGAFKLSEGLLVYTQAPNSFNGAGE